MFNYLKRPYQILRNDEILAIVFFSAAAIISIAYGYSLRFYIFIDTFLHCLWVSPILLTFFFFSYFKNKYLKYGWTFFSAGLSTAIVFYFFSTDFPTFFHNNYFVWCITIGTVIWAFFLVEHLSKEEKSIYLLSHIKIKHALSKILVFLRDWFPLLIVIFSYCTLKSIIPVVNSNNFDAKFNAMDYFLFFNNSPTDLIINWLPVSIMGLLSFGYNFYFILKIITLSSIYFLIDDRQVFYRLALAFSLTYVLGLCLYFIFPAQGPIYYYPEKFNKIQVPMAQTSIHKVQQDLWYVYKSVKQHTPEEFCKLTEDSGIRNGVAAFPSLHIAISCVLLYFLYKYLRGIFWICSFFFCLMVISTIYFGWHYVVDDIAGVILAYIVIVFIKYIPDKNYRYAELR